MRSRPSDRSGFLVAPNTVPATVLLSSTSPTLTKQSDSECLPLDFSGCSLQKVSCRHVVSGLSEFASCQLRFCLRQLSRFCIRHVVQSDSRTVSPCQGADEEHLRRSLPMFQEVDKYDVSECSLVRSFARQKGVDSWYFSVQGLGEYDVPVDHKVTRRSHGCPSLRIAQRQLHH